MVEFDPHNLQKIKLGVHLAQAALIAVSWIIEITVFRSSAKIDGRPGWYFGLCFLTIPAIIFLTMTPRYTRTRQFANPYALATVDGLFCFLWLTAFAAQASFNSSGKAGDGLGKSKAVVGFGVFIWLFWILTTLMSLYGVVYYKREGYLPGASRAPHNAQMIDPDKEAFSTAPHDDEYARVHNVDDNEVIHDAGGPGYGLGSGYGSEPSNPGNQSPRYEAPYTGGYVPPSVHDDTSYSAYAGASSVGSSSGRAQFPDARYDNV
ncbi:hypothetical protein G7Y89_g7686 [Cudoniella acicularis]|uniref:MARVEL domain-containing protein n=1 Tax=Cudoniella acicularis TaxID=354080 RepID=A0A8H4RI17_9HELO|nr:hypothetical protein G7Y89_g7686 [Cudoniella acicularis]